LKRLIVISFVLGVFLLNAQSGINRFLKPSDSLNKARRNAVVITETSLAAITLIGLNQLWYADYPRSEFQTINDSKDWRQMDKLGHVYASYQIGRLSANSLNWAGVSKKNQLIYGGTLGLGFLTAVEVLDGFSSEWGFSWSDMAANGLGSGLYIGQELLWDEQRLLLKYSFHQTSYAPNRPDLLGDGLYEEFLKDYNGQTYWLSINLEAFLKTDIIPPWLNLAFGYGVDGLLSASPDDPTFPGQDRRSQYYLSFDIDLSRIKTKSNFLRTLFDVFNLIKIPLPTVMVDSKGQFKVYALYF
jgi:hypothetical protein